MVFVAGELDAATGPELATLASAFSTLKLSVDFDLAGVTFIDVAGWASVRAAIDVLAASDSRARIANPSRAVRHLTAVFARSRAPRTGAQPTSI